MFVKRIRDGLVGERSFFGSAARGGLLRRDDPQRYPLGLDLVRRVRLCVVLLVQLIYAIPGFLARDRLKYYTAYLRVARRISLVSNHQRDPRVALPVLEFVAVYLGTDKEPSLSVPAQM